MARIAHLTSVHSAKDPRIFLKECKTLASTGYEVVLIVPHGGDETLDDVRIRALPAPSGRFQRLTRTVWQVYRAAVEEDAQVYHFHDPELMPIGLLLKLRGKDVIYDIHEDYITSISQKSYLPRWLRPGLSALFGWLEAALARLFAIIIAEDYYSKRFPHATKVMNYPLVGLAELSEADMPRKNRDARRLLYTGSITEDRGALLHAQVVRNVPEVEVHMVGRCGEGLADRLRQAAGGDAHRLHLEGIEQYVPYDRILTRYAEGGWLAGLAVFPPTPHYRQKQLTKFFEYMDSGIPIVCSDFPVWRSLIDGIGCGLLVDPLDSQSVADAIEWLVENPEGAEEMGRRGQEAVRTRYNWEAESRKLLNLYEGLLR
jgi:glycosyltransferase involved in cell wall biosynthesis